MFCLFNGQAWKDLELSEDDVDDRLWREGSGNRAKNHKVKLEGCWDTFHLPEPLDSKVLFP